MANNISKYISLNDFILLEMEFNKSGENTQLSSQNIKSFIAETKLGDKQYFNQNSIGYLNNDLELNSLPLLANHSKWYINPDDTSSYYDFFDSDSSIEQDFYPFDTVKLHIVSGYNFDDISGFLLQIQAEDTSGNFPILSNFTWINQVTGNDVLKFSTNNLYLAGKFYDKYIELKVPSVNELNGQTGEPIEQALQIKQLSDIYFNFSIIPEIEGNTYNIENKIEFQLPIISNADNFNAFIIESTEGDYIEFYATWKDLIIGNYMGDIESGRIKLYTSNNPNDNYEEFENIYGSDTNKWVVMHELYLYEHIPGNSLLTQQYVFTQSNNFSQANYFRPIIRYADIASSYTLEYICRLTNRMDGTQIIRKASFASTNTKKYGKKLQMLNIDNLSSYKIFNRIENKQAPKLVNSNNITTKFIKIFYDITKVSLNKDNEVLEQGTDSLKLKQTDGVYKFQFVKENEITLETENVDLSGVYQYALQFKLDDENKIEISPTNSENMNTTLGELEFKISEKQVDKVSKQINNKYSIIIINPDKTRYTFYQGQYKNL